MAFSKIAHQSARYHILQRYCLSWLNWLYESGERRQRTTRAVHTRQCPTCSDCHEGSSLPHAPPMFMLARACMEGGCSSRAGRRASATAWELPSGLAPTLSSGRQPARRARHVSSSHCGSDSMLSQTPWHILQASSALAAQGYTPCASLATTAGRWPAGAGRGGCGAAPSTWHFCRRKTRHPLPCSFTCI